MGKTLDLLSSNFRAGTREQKSSPGDAVWVSGLSEPITSGGHTATQTDFMRKLLVPQGQKGTDLSALPLGRGKVTFTSPQGSSLPRHKEGR